MPGAGVTHSQPRRFGWTARIAHFSATSAGGRLEEQDTANEYSWRLDGTFKRASEGRGLNITTSAPVVVSFFTERAPDR